MRRVLVTGGTGMVGGALVEHLPDLEVVSVTRNGAGGSAEARGSGASGLVRSAAGHRLVAPSVEHEAMTHVAGDLTKPLFGLAEAEFDALAEGIDAVVHCAGLTDFTTHRRRTYGINLDGTRHVLDLVRRAGCRLYHVSTAYVFADHAETVKGKWGAGVYIGSKRAAEDAVRESGVDATILRPSIVLGDSRTGASPSFQGLHRLVGQILGGNMPLLPLPEVSRVDFLPRDVVGRELARAVREQARGEVWVTAGPDALEFGRIVDLIMDYAQRLGRRAKRPRFVDREMVERLLRPAFEEELGRKIDLLVALTAHFDPTGAILPRSIDLSDVDLEQALCRNMEFWAERNGLTAATGVAS